MTTRFISDLHWGHANIIAYDNRPFSSIEEMNEAMVALWNETVKPGDLTYVLGDFCWSQKYEDWAALLKKLNGQIFIIKGNHDRTEILKHAFRDRLIVDYAEQHIASVDGMKLVLNHSPMPFFINEHHDGWAHLYGHVHISYDWNMVLNMQRQISQLYLKDIRMYNVGAMIPYINYIPRTFAEIEEGFKNTDLLQINFSQRHAWSKPANK